MYCMPWEPKNCELLEPRKTENKPLQEPAFQDGHGNQIQQLQYRTAYDLSDLVLSQLMHVSDGKGETVIKLL